MSIGVLPAVLFTMDASQPFNEQLQDGRQIHTPASPSAASSSSAAQVEAAETDSPGDSNKPNLSVIVDNASASPAGSTTGASLWGQPYSELSRFPSASYRFKKQEWFPDGSARYMTPLPSPLPYDSRNRSFSNASDASVNSVGAESNLSGYKSPGSVGSSTANVTSSGPRTAPSRSKTRAFFETEGSAFSPPPPPRMPSADFRVLNRKSLDMLSSMPERPKTNPLSASVPPSASTSSAPSEASQLEYKPLSNLPSSIRTEKPPTSSTPSNNEGRNQDSMRLQHRRTPSETSASATPTVPSILGRHTAIQESPLASPTESQSSRWLREPPGRLPTLPFDAQVQMPKTSPPLSVSSLSISEALEEDDQPKASTSRLNSGTVPAPSSTLTPASECECGAVLHDEYQVVKSLGLGSFSKVVLAKRIAKRARPPSPPRPRRSESPQRITKQPVNHRQTPSGTYPSTIGKGHARARLGGSNGASKLNQSYRPDEDSETEELVAIKLISRNHIKKNDRMRISIVREVEVLKHIRHPCLVHLTASFDTMFHTCLVLEYAEGGELFDFLANHHEQMSEALARRIFGELADALGWMHSIGLVHRDIKLENILLTSRPFPKFSPTPITFPPPLSLPPISSPFVKLTDFGLSRFIDPNAPYLETRCGSEEYAAPELIMGKRYDGRQTDAWALGVVLFAIITGSLPFLETTPTSSAPNSRAHSPAARGSTKSRRSYLLRIAKADYSWPERSPDEDASSSLDDSTRLVNDAVKKLVGGLLSRDPKNRVRTEDVWDFEWMTGAGLPEKRSVRGGNLEGVSVSEFGLDDGEIARSEIPQAF